MSIFQLPAHYFLDRILDLVKRLPGLQTIRIDIHFPYECWTVLKFEDWPARVAERIFYDLKKYRQIIEDIPGRVVRVKDVEMVSYVRDQWKEFCRLRAVNHEEFANVHLESETYESRVVAVEWEEMGKITYGDNASWNNGDWWKDPKELWMGIL